MSPSGGGAGAGAAGTVAAVDLGATSGRVVVGRVDGRGAGALEIRQVARFANEPVRLASGLHWNLSGLSRSITAGLAQAIREEPAVASIGVDSWAVDYALLRGERVLGEPFHYRDERTAAGVEAVHAVVPFAELYRRNGLQFLPFNTLYQLAAERDDPSGCLGVADTLLLVPDLIAFQLTGERVAERTNASTTGLLGVESREWDDELIERLGLPRSVFPRLVEPGESIGVAPRRRSRPTSASARGIRSRSSPSAPTTPRPRSSPCRCAPSRPRTSRAARGVSWASSWSIR